MNACACVLRKWIVELNWIEVSLCIGYHRQEATLQLTACRRLVHHRGRRGNLWPRRLFRHQWRHRREQLAACAVRSVRHRTLYSCTSGPHTIATGPSCCSQPQPPLGVMTTTAPRQPSQQQQQQRRPSRHSSHRESCIVLYALDNWLALLRDVTLRLGGTSTTELK